MKLGSEKLVNALINILNGFLCHSLLNIIYFYYEIRRSKFIRRKGKFLTLIIYDFAAKLENQKESRNIPDFLTRLFFKRIS
jgi:hypothetical protein